MTGVLWEGSGRDDGRDENGKIPLFNGLGAIRRERWAFFNNARLIFNKAALFIDNAALLALIFLL